jgi:hypothetical protein
MKSLLAVARFVCLYLLCVLSGVEVAGAKGPQCFRSLPPNNHAAAFVAPKSDVCRAFAAALNARCDTNVQPLALGQKGDGSSLTSPDWLQISLFDAQGSEIPEGFALLAKLISGRAMAMYGVERESSAARDVESIISRVRAAHAQSLDPRLEKATLDLTGHGRKEGIYRLVAVKEPNSQRVPERPFTAILEFFLERTIELDSSKPRTAASASLLNISGDVLLFEGVPYITTWGASETFLVYASYVLPNRPRIPDEEGLEEIFILPTLACMFQFVPLR